jgi:uncharacterized LabA/DUF88 family protein
MIQRKERVCAFVDNSNLFHNIKNLSAELGEDKKLDYFKLRNVIADDRSLEVRFYYSQPEDCVDEVTRRQHGFYDFLSDKLGYFLIALPLRERSGYNPTVAALVRMLQSKGVSEDEILKIAKQRSYWLKQVLDGTPVAEEKGLDCEIVYDMVRLSQGGHYDTFVLIAGDEDYARTVRRLRIETGIRIEVAFFGGRCSTVLRREASEFIDLATVPDLFCSKW